jgi:dTDP-4-amino-4,6-dideoxygalactose transaminase
MLSDFSFISGGSPTFSKPLPVGQLYFPEWARYEAAMRGIFERRYYTNHGPLVQKLESELSRFLGVKHVVCVTNATIGLMMAADALDLSGKVIAPSHTFIATAESLKWCGLRPVYCDVDPQTQQTDPKAAARLIDEDVSAILAVNLWGGACDVVALQSLADAAGISLYFDSAHAFGCAVANVPVAGFGRAEVFSFHATKVLSAGEGGCVTTDDDDVAARLRNIRSSYGAGPPARVVRTSNGRMSEAQAAIALLSLEDYPAIQARNKALFDAYSRGLAEIPGIRLLHPTNVTASNYQYAACTVDPGEFGLTRDQLQRLLQAENVMARRYFYPGTHRSVGFDENAEAEAARLPFTERLCVTSIQLPLGAHVNLPDVERICALIASAQADAPELRRRMTKVD